MVEVKERFGDVAVNCEGLLIVFFKLGLGSLGDDGFACTEELEEFDVLERDGIVPRVEFSMIDGIEVSDDVGLKNGSDEY